MKEYDYFGSIFGAPDSWKLPYVYMHMYVNMMPPKICLGIFLTRDSSSLRHEQVLIHAQVFCNLSNHSLTFGESSLVGTGQQSPRRRASTFAYTCAENKCTTMSVYTYAYMYTYEYIYIAI